jgi:4-hydroxy-tetrahydrodipicolinate reductase
VSGSPRIALIGLGKMGRTVMQLAEERGWPVVAALNAAAGGPTRERLGDANVAIEFSTPAAAPGNVIACARAGVPVVVGTTGWDAEHAFVEREVLAHGGAMLASPNFSLGVAIFFQAAERLAQLAGGSRAFAAHITETHHAHKLDAPSGTAKELARLAGAAFGSAIPVTSVRVGSVPGTHEIIFDGAFEQLRLVHEARDRRVFAEGALAAAAWIIGKRGVFTMRDLFAGEGKG